MENEDQSWGAKAKVYLKYDGDIKALAEIISKGLLLPEFTIDTDMDPPHDTFAYCEALGFEIDIYQSKDFSDFGYYIIIATENCHDEIMNDRMHDISIWLEKFISLMCGLKTFI